MHRPWRHRKEIYLHVGMSSLLSICWIAISDICKSMHSFSRHHAVTPVSYGLDGPFPPTKWSNLEHPHREKGTILQTYRCGKPMKVDHVRDFLGVFHIDVNAMALWYPSSRAWRLARLCPSTKSLPQTDSKRSRRTSSPGCGRVAFIPNCHRLG